MKIKAKIYKADTPNANGLIYSKATLEDAVKEFSKQERNALYGNYPPDSNRINVNDILGIATIEFVDDYVEATITPYKSNKSKFEKTLKGCIEIKVLPTGMGRIETVNNISQSVTNLVITHITCTCGYINTGNARKEMFFANIIEDSFSKKMHFV